ncbi:hypothetical protein AXA44_34595 [Rhodococcus sp. SC4]|nr:hypothetical protein AXA44_34595 [Rhodococcus sp. SC4]
MGILDGKVAIITGAARGQGEAEARLFATEGAKLVLTDINPDVGKLADELGDRAVGIEHDVSQQEQWATVLDTAISTYGRLDVLVNNAGIFKPGSVTDTSLEDWERAFRINQTGVFLGMQTVVQHMIKAKRGSIVNISSISAHNGIERQIAYAASKWAIRGMTKTAANDLAPYGIRVNAIAPGVIDTPMLDTYTPEKYEEIKALIPFGRLGTADEVARLVAFVASDQASYITGADLQIDGAALVG